MTILLNNITELINKHQLLNLTILKLRGERHVYVKLEYL